MRSALAPSGYAESPALHPPRLAREWPCPALVFALLVLLYGFTAPRGVALEDDGFFVMAARYLGIAHPPGYPLYTLLAHLATHAPLGSVAYRVHLFSAVMGAATCSVIWWIARTLTASPTIAAVAALAFGASAVMWSQSIIAEVYTLNTFLYFLLFGLALAYLRSRRAYLLPVMGVVFGLGLSNHHPLLLLGTPCLGLVLWPVRTEILRRLPIVLPAIAFGLLPYLWMVLRSRADPPISFYGPIRSLGEFFFYVSREGYSQVQSSPTAGLHDKLRFVVFLARESVAQYTPLGFAFAAVGAATLLRNARLSFGLGLVTAFLGGGMALLMLFDSDFQRLERLVIRVFPLIPYGVMCIWLALGLACFRDVMKRRYGERAGSAAVAIGACLVATLVVTNLRALDRSGYSFAEDYARTVLESLEPDAILVTYGDLETQPIGYLHLVAGVRPDVDLYQGQGLSFANRLFHAKDEDASGRAAAFRELIESTDRPVYFISRWPLGFGFEDFGLFSRIDRSSPDGEVRYRVRHTLLAYSQRLHEAQLDDEWSAVMRDLVLAGFAAVLVHAIAESPEPWLSQLYQEHLDALRSRYPSALAALREEISLATRPPEQLLAAIAEAEALLEPDTPKRHRSLLHVLRGRALAALQRDDEARAQFLRALAIFPASENEAVMELLRLYSRTGEREKYLGLRRRLHAPNQTPELRELDRRMGV